MLSLWGSWNLLKDNATHTDKVLAGCRICILREGPQRQPGAGRAVQPRAARRRPEEATAAPWMLALTSPATAEDPTRV